MKRQITGRILSATASTGSPGGSAEARMPSSSGGDRRRPEHLQGAAGADWPGTPPHRAGRQRDMSGSPRSSRVGPREEGADRGLRQLKTRREEPHVAEAFKKLHN